MGREPWLDASQKAGRMMDVDVAAGGAAVDDGSRRVSVHDGTP
jgi:hypothetical protein